MCDDQPFSVIESGELRTLICMLRHGAKIPSADTITREVVRAFEDQCNEIRNILQVMGGWEFRYYLE